LDEMIAIGEITEQERNKVFFVRLLAADDVDHRRSRGAMGGPYQM
jgi:hypothetical protein